MGAGAVAAGAGAGAAAVGAGAGVVDSADEDSDSESDGDELPELGLADPIGDIGGPITALTSSSLSDKPRSLFTTSGETELLEFDIRLSKPGLGRGVLRSLAAN